MSLPDIVLITVQVSYLLTLLLIPVVLLTRPKQPVSTVAWVMAIINLPLLGALLFIVFGINRVERRAARKQLASDKILRSLPELTQYQLIPGEAESERHVRLMRLATRVAESSPTHGNRVDVMDDTLRTLAYIEEAIQSAKDTLHLEYYIWQPDKTGTRIRDLLIKKAKEGVTVRFLYDGIGSLRLSRRFLQPMLDAGIKVASFLPGANFHERWSINLRSHRKIVIVDGHIGFTGGMNIGDEYIGKDPNLGFWRDTHLRLYGPVVLQLQQVFAEDWYYATNEELTHPEVFPFPSETGNVVAQVVAGEPAGDVGGLHALMFGAINEAREQLLLTTSYFVPTEPLLAALEAAALRGVRVRLMLPAKSDHRSTIFAAHSYYEALMSSGVEIYEYRRGLMHAKTLTIDGDWSMIGSPNFDARSLLLNFEIGVITYDSRTAMQLVEHFEKDMKYAKRVELEPWLKRGPIARLPESIFRLFAPVL